MADYSRLRNAVRDCAESMMRFERDFGRMQREMKTATAEGATIDDLNTLANEALRSKPAVLEKFAELIDRIASEAALQQGEES